jgi:hypothetical protein
VPAASYSTVEVRPPSRTPRLRPSHSRAVTRRPGCECAKDIAFSPMSATSGLHQLRPGRRDIRPRAAGPVITTIPNRKKQTSSSTPKQHTSAATCAAARRQRLLSVIGRPSGPSSVIGFAAWHRHDLVVPTGSTLSAAREVFLRSGQLLTAMASQPQPGRIAHPAVASEGEYRQQDPRAAAARGRGPRPHRAGGHHGVDPQALPQVTGHHRPDRVPGPGHALSAGPRRLSPEPVRGQRPARR